MSPSEEPEDHDASVVHSTEARAHQSLPEVLDSPRAKLVRRCHRIVTEARVEDKRRTPDTKALALSPVLDILTEREFGERTGNAYTIAMEAHE